MVLNQEPVAKTEVEKSKIAPILCFATGLDVVAVLRQPASPEIVSCHPLPLHGTKFDSGKVAPQ